MPDVKKIQAFRSCLISGIIAGCNDNCQFHDIGYNIRANTKGDMLAFSSDNPLQVSYATKPEYRYDSNKRTRTRLGRYLLKTFANELCSFGCSDKQLDTFVKNVLEYSPQTEESFKLVRGNDIVDAYRNEIGGSSCMTGNDSHYTNMYSQNDNVQLLIYRHLNIIARALVWTCDDETIVMDRIYPNSGAHVKIMQKYAKSKGWEYRLYTGMPGYNVDLSDDDTHKITLKSPNGIWPYMDTFRHAKGDIHLSRVCNHNPGQYNVVLDSTEGEYGDTTECDDCGDRYESSDMTNIGDDYICEYCRDHSYTWSDLENDYIRDDDAICLEDTGGYVSSWYATKYCYTCDDCDSYYRQEDNITTFDSHVYCDSCLQNVASYCGKCDELTDNTNLNSDCECEECTSKENEGVTI